MTEPIEKLIFLQFKPRSWFKITMLVSDVNEYFLQQWKANKVQIAQIEHFARLILATVGKLNLTGHKTFDKICRKLMVEGIMPFQQMQNLIATCTNVMDVGTGAGIPGILLKIFFPNLNVFLVESSQKKCKFLKTVMIELNLQKITLLPQRVENLGSLFSYRFDLITARALASMRTCLPWMEPYLKIDGKIVLAKSDHAQNEYESCRKVMQRLGLELAKIYQIENKINCVSYHAYVFQRASRISSIVTA